MKPIASPRRRLRFDLACLTVSAVLWAAAAAGQPLKLDASSRTLTVDDHRPLAALAGELEKRYQIVVTYEEGPWADAADLEDVTQKLIEANGPGKAAPAVPMIVPRKAAVSFEYPVDPAKGLPADQAGLLTSLLGQYEAAGAPGKFGVEGGDGIFHLVPSQLKDAKGRWTDAKPVLSIPVRLAEEERTINDTLDAVVAQINAASPVKVGWGYVPLNLFVQTKIRLSADGVPARAVLRRILEQLPRRATWRLNYDPTTKRYYLSFLLLPGER